MPNLLTLHLTNCYNHTKPSAFSIGYYALLPKLSSDIYLFCSMHMHYVHDHTSSLALLAY